MTPTRTSLLFALALSLTGGFAAAQDMSAIQVAAPTRAPSPGGRMLIEAEGDAVALEIFGPRGSNSVQCSTPCSLAMPFGTYSVHVHAAGDLTAHVSLYARTQRYVYRRGGAGVGWKVLTVWGAINVGGGLLLTGLGGIGLASSSSLDRGLGTASLGIGILGLIVGAIMVIPGAIGWASAAGPSLREANEVASVRALRSRRVAVMSAGQGNPFALAPSVGFTPSVSFAF